MRFTQCLIGLLALLVVPALVVAQPVSSCGAKTEVVQNSYHRLDDKSLKGVFVYVGDIPINLLGMTPFDIFVVYGTVYEPFPASSGRLKFNDFQRLVRGKPSFIVQSMRVQKQDQTAYPFKYGGKTYRILVQVPFQFRKEGAMTVSVCWP